MNILTPLQKRLLATIKHVDDICKRNNITYYLGGGTALGAIRHRGFLPWDDDADLYITRDNWLKLEKVLEKELPDNLTLVTTKTHPHYKNPLCRIVDEESTIFYKSRIADETPHGVQVEFFILDPIPNDKQLRQEYFKNLWLYVELLVPYFMLSNERLPEEVTDLRAYLKERIRAAFVGRTKVLKELEDKLFNYKEEDCDDLCLRWGQRAIVYSKDIYQEPTYVDFEDVKLPVSTKVESQLRIDYGDTWMDVPSTDDQIVHEFFGNLDKSYKEHMGYIHKYVDLKKMRRNLAKRKTRNVVVYHYRQKARKELFVLKRIAQELKLKQILEKYAEIESNFLAQNFSEIVDIFGDYISAQGSKIFIRQGAFLEIEDEILYRVLLSLVMVGRYYDADKILSLRRNQPKEMSDEIGELHQLIQSIREISVSRCTNELFNKQDEIESILAKYPNQIDATKADILLKINSKNSDLDALESRVKNLMEVHPEDGDFIKFLADIYFTKGDYDNALDVYIKAQLSTRNGIILLDINDRLKELGYSPEQEDELQQQEDEPLDEVLMNMNELQKKVFTLLKEVDECCTANDISYYLHAETALHAYRTGELHPEAPYAKLAILASSVDDFLKALGERQREDRVIDHWGNNEKYPDFSIRYSDKNSLCYGYATHGAYSCNGVYLVITIVRRNTDARLAKMRFERGIRLNSGISYRQLHPKRLFLKYGVKVLMLLRGRKIFLKEYFRKSTCASTMQSLAYRIEARQFPYLFFGGPASHIELYGQQFQTYNQLEAFFEHYFGRAWKTKEIYALSPNLIIDATIDEESYKDALSSHGWSDRRVFLYRRIISLLRRHKLNKKIKAQQRTTNDIVNMIYLKELYLPKKAEIMELYFEGDFDGLKEELAHYLELIETRERAVHFDAELFEIVMMLLRRDKGEIFVTRIEASVRHYDLSV